MKNEERVIERFEGRYSFLSNFFYAPILYKGIRYANNEAAFQAQKTCDYFLRRKFGELDDPGAAKHFGRTLALRSDWEKIKLQEMYCICAAKFFQHKYLAAKLLRTGNAMLIEGNNHNDFFWGMVENEGENHLGLILMDIREKLRIEDCYRNEMRKAKAL